jgi:chromosome segregation ATPase
MKDDKEARRLKSKVEALEINNKRLEEEIIRLETLNRGFRSETAERDSALNIVRASNTCLEKELSALRKEKGDLEAKNRGLQDTVEALEKHLGILEDKRKSFEEGVQFVLNEFPWMKLK